MLAEIVISGSGGQGVLVIGRLLAEAGFLEGKEVVWSPSYSAEKRGGTVSCMVTISSEKIGALMITRPTIGIAMNHAAAVKLEPSLKKGGWLLVNQADNAFKPARRDIQFLDISANRLALEMGSESTANIIALGALLAAHPVVSLDGVIKAMAQLFGDKTLEMNKQALITGSQSVKTIEKRT
jgi:2-oxoglutarate ferredoxin oxidoreductase subunit gamma